jgi:arabinose-5-phosphate isomerase
VIGSQEVVIAVSNSGETSELSALMPYLRRRGVPVIAIVGNLRSSLGREAAVALEAFAAREAGHLDLVPTASSTVALAVGDALAIAVMELKGTTAESFAENHPSGRLGRRLTLRVRDVMHTGGERAALGPDASLLDAVTAIGAGGMGAVVILEDGDRLAGSSPTATCAARSSAATRPS